MRTLHGNIKSVRIFAKAGKINIDYYTTDGKRHRFSTGIADTKQNRTAIDRQKLSRAEDHFESHRPSDAKTLFKDIGLEAIDSTKDNRASYTHQDYVGLLERSLIPHFGNMQIGEIRPMHIEKWKASIIKQGISKSRFHKHWTTARMVFGYCVKNEMIDKDPMQYVERNSKAFKPPVNRSKEYYTQSEVTAILEHAEGWFKTFMHTLFLTGMRTGEAMALQWENIDFEKKQITIEHSLKKGVIKCTKTGQTRIVDMATPLYNVLKVHYDKRCSESFLFPSTKDVRKPFYEAHTIVKHHLKPLLESLNISYKTLYATRHSFASNLVLKNAPITYVQKMLGHSKLTTTMDFYVKNGLIDSAEMTPILDSMYSA